MDWCAITLDMATNPNLVLDSKTQTGGLQQLLGLVLFPPPYAEEGEENGTQTHEWHSGCMEVMIFHSC